MAPSGRDRAIVFEGCRVPVGTILSLNPTTSPFSMRLSTCSLFFCWIQDFMGHFHLFTLSHCPRFGS